jgi:hypothetical protein
MVEKREYKTGTMAIEELLCFAAKKHRGLVRWMWSDLGPGAESNRFRWSERKSIELIVIELANYEHISRPVRVSLESVDGVERRADCLNFGDPKRAIVDLRRRIPPEKYWRAELPSSLVPAGHGGRAADLWKGMNKRLDRIEDLFKGDKKAAECFVEEIRNVEVNIGNLQIEAYDPAKQDPAELLRRVKDAKAVNVVKVGLVSAAVNISTTLVMNLFKAFVDGYRQRQGSPASKLKAGFSALVSLAAWKEIMSAVTKDTLMCLVFGICGGLAEVLLEKGHWAQKVFGTSGFYFVGAAYVFIKTARILRSDLGPCAKWSAILLEMGQLGFGILGGMLGGMCGATILAGFPGLIIGGLLGCLMGTIFGSAWTKGIGKCFEFLQLKERDALHTLGFKHPGFALVRILFWVYCREPIFGDKDTYLTLQVLSDPAKASKSDRQRVLRLLNKNYKEQMRTAHPDKGGSHAASLRVQAAYIALRQRVDMMPCSDASVLALK